MYKSLKLGEIELRPWLIACLMLFETLPKWMWNMYQLLPEIVPILILFLAYKDIARFRSNGWAIASFFIQLIVLLVFYHERSTNIIGLGIIIVGWIAFLPLFLCSPGFLTKCIKCFALLLAAFLACALVEHILIFFFNIFFVAPSYGECPYNPEREYILYFFNAYINDFTAFTILPRFFAFYDEPGALGNIVMVFLYCGRFDLRKWYNIVFMISGLLSFSLAFYIAMIVWYIVFGTTRVKIAFIIISVLAVYYFWNNDYLYDLIFSRFEFTDEGLAGYNRERGEFTGWFDNLLITDYLFWGYRPIQKVIYAASWKWAFALYGIIPCIVYTFTLIKSRVNKLMTPKDILMGAFIIVVIFIQRPFFYRWIYVLLMIMPLIAYSFYEKDKNAHKEVKQK